MMKIAFIGLNGQLGIAFIKYFLKQFNSNNIVLLYRHNLPTSMIRELDHYKTIQFDSNNLDQIIKDNHITDIIYTPSLWTITEYLDSLISIKRIICYSSTSILTKINSANIYEQNIVKKLHNAENEVQNFCKLYDINYTILRPTMIYGVGLDSNISLIYRTFTRYHFFPVAINSYGLRQPVHVKDLLQAAILCLTHPNTYNKTYNLSGAEKLTYQAMLQRIKQYVSSRSFIIKIPFFKQILDFIGLLLKRNTINGEIAARMSQDLVFDHDQAKADFGYQPQGFLANGVRDFSI